MVDFKRTIALAVEAYRLEKELPEERKLIEEAIATRTKEYSSQRLTTLGSKRKLWRQETKTGYEQFDSAMKAYLSGNQELHKKIYEEVKAASPGEEPSVKEFRIKLRRRLTQEYAAVNHPISLDEQIHISINLAEKAYQATPTEAESAKTDYIKEISSSLSKRNVELGSEAFSAESRASAAHKKMVEKLQATTIPWVEVSAAVNDYKNKKEIAEILRNHQMYLTSFYFDAQGTNIDEQYADAKYIYEKSYANSTNVNEFRKNISAELDDLFFRSTKVLAVLAKINYEPDIRSLYEAIGNMKVFGMSISKDHPTEGKEAMMLAEKLMQKADVFFAKSFKQISNEEVNKFKVEFKDLLHSKDRLMHWKPIVANIMVALTGVGLLAIAAKAIYSAVKDKDKGFSAYSGLFFFDNNRFKELTDSTEKKSSRAFGKNG